MSPTAVFNHDHSDVSRVYAAARTWPSQAWAVWRAATSGIVPAEAGAIRTIVDAGCGTGRFSPILAEIFDAAVVGVDPSAKMFPTRPGCVASARLRFT
jgi:SAM-dependent methyltransferase